MKTETIKTLETVTKTIYITEDGQTFNQSWQAKQHERYLLEKQVKKSPDIIFKDNGLIPYESYMDEDNQNYIWCKPLNETGANLLNETWGDPDDSEAVIGKWICYEFSDGEIYTHTLDSTIRNFEILGKSLGFKVSIEWED